MSWMPDITPPSPHLVDELGIKWGANRVECLRLLGPDPLAKLLIRRSRSEQWDSRSITAVVHCAAANFR
jgi:hypothetical protein